MIIGLGGQGGDKAVFFKDGNRCALVKVISWKGVNQEMELEQLIGAEIYNQLKVQNNTEFQEHPRLISFVKQLEFNLDFDSIVKEVNDRNRIRYNNFRSEHSLGTGNYDYVYKSANKGQLYFKEWNCTEW